MLWAALQPRRLPARAAKLLGSCDADASFSVATLWEVAVKTSLGRPDFNADAAKLRRWLLSERFAELTIAPSHLLKVAPLPWHHRDPFDRLLVAQAQVEGISLLTADAALNAYGRAVKILA